MKFQCEACERLVPLETFRLEATGLVVTCGRCGAESRARATASPSSAVETPEAAGSDAPSSGGAPAWSSPVPEAVATRAPPPPARSSAPALRVVRTGEGAAPRMSLADEDLFSVPPGHCPKCVAARREGTLACAQCGLVDALFVPEESQPSEPLAMAWRETVREWDDWAAHERVLALAMGRGELAMVGRLYRLRLARAPGDTLAQRGRDEVLRRATVVPTTLERRGTSQESVQRVKKVLAGVVLVVVLVLIALVLRQLFAMG